MGLTIEINLGEAPESAEIPTSDEAVMGNEDIQGPLPEETNFQLPVGAEAPPIESGGFTDDVAEGFGITEDTTFKEWLGQLKDESVTVKAGGVLSESLVETGFKGIKGNPELVKANREADIYRKWMPQIWDVETNMSLNNDKTSPEYQDLYVQKEELKKNLVDDLAGNYVPLPTESISMSKMLDAATDNPGFMIGAIAKAAAADPGIMMIPAGWTKLGFAAANAARAITASSKLIKTAEISGRVLGGASIAGGIGGVADVVNQLDNNPNAPIDFASVRNTIAHASILGAVLPAGAAGITGAVRGTKTAVSNTIGKFYTDAKINQIKDEAVQMFNQAEGGLTKQQAIEQAVAKHHPFNQEKILTKLDDADAVIDDTAARIAQGTNRVPETFVEKFSRMSLESVDDIMAGWNNLVQPIITGIRRLGFLGVATNLLKHDRLEMKKLSDRLIIKDGYSQAIKDAKLSKSERGLLKFHTLNGTLDEVAGDFSPAIIKAYKDVRAMLDTMRAEMIDNGMLRNAADTAEDKLPGVEKFWPRSIDFKAYAKSKGVDVRNFDIYAKTINKKYNLAPSDQFQGKHLTSDLINDYLSPEEIALAIADTVAGKITPKTTIASDPLTSRTVDLITPEDLQFYADDVLSLTDYILKMTPKIEARNFFGGELLKAGPRQREKFLASKDIPSADPLAPSMVKGFVNDYTRKLVDQGDILAEKAPELAGLLEARFAGGFKRPNRFIAGSKNVMYGMLLGNAWSASVQLGDLGSSAYINGTMRTINAVHKNALKKAGVDVKDFLDMDDFGLSAMAHEMEHLGPTAAFNDFALKYGMFKMADRVGKQAIMNASVAKNVSAVKNLSKLRAEGADTAKAEAQALKHFRKEYGDKVDDETVRGMMEAFIRGDIKAPDAMLATFADITKVQPISLSEMPKLYLNHPNGRIVYMLKTFTLKQVDLLRTSIIQTTVRETILAKSKKGKIAAVARGTGRLAHLMGTVGLANASVDVGRQWLTGKDFELSEAMFASGARTWGYNEDAVRWIGAGRPGYAAGALLMPPVGVLIEPLGYLSQGEMVDFLFTLPVIRAGKRFRDTADDENIPTFSTEFTLDTEYKGFFEE